MTSANHVLLSICIPTYKRAEIIRELLISINEQNVNHKYYELYKDGNKEVKYFNLNRIKYYQEAENDNKENEPQINNNEIINNNQKINDDKNNFGIGLTEVNLNNKMMNSFYGDKNRAKRDNNCFSSRIRTTSCSSLVCPSNIIKNKLNSDF